jgi:tetratricopeptide (TPR) repeat protein
MAMSLRTIVLLAAFLHAAPAMADLFPETENGKALFKQGTALMGEGKRNEALQRFREAALADPKASTPVAHIAYLYYRSSLVAPAKEVDAQRQEAAAAANAALKLDQRDPLGMEVLRLLADGQAQVRHQPSAAVSKAVGEGELLFHDKKYAAAAEKYEQAVRLDPEYAEGFLFLGDCYFMQNEHARAEQLFRQATQVDPLYSMAWRFLFDVQMKQGKLKDAEASAIGAIAARPSERQSWQRVNQLMQGWGNKLTPFRLVPHAKFKDKTIELDVSGSTPENSIWLLYGAAMANAAEKLPDASPFARDLEAWVSTMTAVNELEKKDPVKDEGIRAMLRFYKAGELKTAMFLLLYREAYRPDFEAWKKANPGAIKHFIDTFQVGL